MITIEEPGKKVGHKVGPRPSVQSAVHESLEHAASERVHRPHVALPPPGLDPTSTPKFQRWFKASKVVSLEGVPLLVHHGTAEQDLQAFRRGGIESLGVHLGTRAQAVKRGSEMLDLYAAIQNPIRLADCGDWRPKVVLDQLRRLGFDPREAKNANRLRVELERLGFDGVVYLNRYEGLRTDALNLVDHNWKYGPAALSDEAFKKRFPDAQDSWIVFHPHQVKSARGNCGAFDPLNPSLFA